MQMHHELIRTALFAASAALAVSFSLMLWTAYSSFIFVFIILPIVCLALIVVLIIAASGKDKKLAFSGSTTLIAFLLVLGAMIFNARTLRPHLRWLFWSRRFKAELLAQPGPMKTGLSHVGWEATGFAGVANNTDYLVFDPRDSITATDTPRRYPGIPCEVPRVLRLEKYWYSVSFYTDEDWDNCTKKK